MAERPPFYMPKRPRHWAFRKPRKQENQYARELMRIVRHIAEFLSGFDTKSLPNYLRAAALLENYADTIRPWAERLAERMVERVNLAEFSAWDKHSKDMSRLLRRELKNAPTGIAARNLVQYQVELITSLPREAAQRVQKIAIDNLVTGKRADTIAKEIMATGEVTKSRAMMIARTETGRAQTSLTQARAQSIGSPGYFWRTVGDSDVRPSHRKMEAVMVRWDQPPTLDGLAGHAGCLPNCFTGNTQVDLSNGCSRIWRVPYQGDVADITLANGVRFTATPNHPMLSPRGWTKIGVLNEGDDLIQALRKDIHAFQHYEDGQFPTFDQMFGAFRGRAVTEAAFDFDFHGDVPNGDVDSIAFDEGLPFNRQACLVQRGGNFPLSLSDGEMRPGIGSASIGQVLHSPLSGVGSQPFEFGGASSFEPRRIGFASVSYSNALVFDHFVDRHAGGAVGDGQRERAFAGAITSDDFLNGQIIPSKPRLFAMVDDHASLPQGFAEVIGGNVQLLGGGFDCAAAFYKPLRIVDKVVREFTGHVYTIETLTGWYKITPAEVVAKNCRCYAEPIIPEI